MQCYYTTRFKARPSTGEIQIDFRLTNELVSNYEYSNGDGHVTTSIEPADDVMTVMAALWAAMRSENTGINRHYRYMIR